MNGEIDWPPLPKPKPRRKKFYGIGMDEGGGSDEVNDFAILWSEELSENQLLWAAGETNVIVWGSA